MLYINTIVVVVVTTTATTTVIIIVIVFIIFNIIITIIIITFILIFITVIIILSSFFAVVVMCCSRRMRTSLRSGPTVDLQLRKSGEVGSLLLCPHRLGHVCPLTASQEGAVVKVGGGGGEREWRGGGCVEGGWLWLVLEVCCLLVP